MSQIGQNGAAADERCQCRLGGLERRHRIRPADAAVREPPAHTFVRVGGPRPPVKDRKRGEGRHGQGSAPALATGTPPARTRRRRVRTLAGHHPRLRQYPEPQPRPLKR